MTKKIQSDDILDDSIYEDNQGQSDALPERNFEKLKASLVSLISHELRTPLTYISASLEMLEIAYENPEMQSEIKRFLKIIDQGVKQLYGTIDELLLFSSTDDQSNNKPQNQIQIVDLQRLVLEVLNILKPTYQKRQQVLEVAIQEDLPRLEIDPSKLAEIVLQLLSNAIKFTPEQGHIRVMVLQVDEDIQIFISDNGPGIPPDVEAQIFDPFYQREDYLTRESGGLGLGLTLVQRLCHTIRARLTMTQEEAGYTGTNFVVSIPLERPPEPSDLDFQKQLEQMKSLTASNAEKEAQLTSMKAQLLKYTEDLYHVYRSNDQKQNDLDSIYQDMMGGFAAALQVRDPFTRGRAQRIATYADMMADALDFNETQARTLQQACLLCDIGYIGISDEVLNKADTQTLTSEERAHIQTHPQIAAEMLQQIKPFKEVVPVILHHHENWDGSGYPQGLAGNEIPYLSRLLRLVDAYDAMLSDRSYRTRFSPEYAMQEIVKFAGSQFDPELVKLFKELWEAGKVQALIPSPKPIEED